MSDIEVRTTAGRVRGRWEGPVAVFRGVPFAAPPVGAHRFQAPAPVTPWPGVRDATEFAPAPPQPNRPTTGDDWLTVTVWTPDPGPAALPVVVWFTGGGFLACDASNPHLDGALLATSGVVVISAHYRPGAEGLLHITGAPDNRILLDHLAALDWVHANARAFGGDVSRITALGQSAGANTIAALLTMPAAHDAFSRAALQSIPGTYFTPDLAAALAEEICTPLSRTPTLTDLADIDPDVLMSSCTALRDRLPTTADRWGAVAYSSTPFSLIVDGDLLPSTPWQAMTAAPDIPLLIAHTRDEYRLLAAHLPPLPVDTVIDQLTPTPGASAYRSAFPDMADADLVELALADWLYRIPALHLAEAAHRAGNPVWFYELTWGFGPNGATHGLDTLLLYGTTDITGEVTTAGPQSLAESHTLSTTLRQDLVSFATTGTPPWPQFTPPTHPTRVYTPDPELHPYPEPTSRSLWQSHPFTALDLPR